MARRLGIHGAGQFPPKQIIVMSGLTYIRTDMHYSQSQPGKPLVWMEGPIKTPPFSAEARIEAGMLLRRLQQGENFGLPHSRPMPDLGPRCHELRIRIKIKLAHLLSPRIRCRGHS
jgi:hypothetical protein